MKNYIWTFWTKPQRGNMNYLDLASLCLSVEAVKKHGNSLCVYTDDVGERMIKEIGLDVKTSTILNSIEAVPSEKWVIAKMISYLNTKEPVCHIDTDVFLWEQQYHNLRTDFIVQAEEFDDIYKDVCNDYILDTLTLPEEIKPYSSEGIFAGFNMGYVDIYNIDFLHKYAKRCIEVQESMKSFSNFNALFPEQYLFYCMSYSEKINVDVLFAREDKKISSSDHWWIINDSNGLSYTHLMNAKRVFKDKMLNAIVYKLKELNPKLANYFYYVIRNNAHLNFNEQEKDVLKRTSIGSHLIFS